jgi:hypothetical protein
MRDYQTFRKSAIRYWERRRIFYNLALVPPAYVGFFFTDTLNWVGDPHETHYSYVLPWFAVCGFAANICYTIAYALEFLLGNDDPMSGWLRFNRSAAFVGGTLFSMFLALMGGYNIAQMEWHYAIKHRLTMSLQRTPAELVCSRVDVIGPASLSSFR